MPETSLSGGKAALDATSRRDADVPLDARPTVLALHCSGATGRQWRHLTETLGAGFEVVAPDLLGTPKGGAWAGAAAFSLTAEVERLLPLLDAAPGPVHVVGHSYGGGVALRLAHERPAGVASLTLYEPSAFHLLADGDTDGDAALDQIRSVAGDVEWGLVRGDYAGAAARFVDYWNGRGAWSALRDEHRAELIRYVPKACLDFRALIEEPTRLAHYRGVGVPALVLRGEHALPPSRLIAVRLARTLGAGRPEVVAGAGHMGPFTHAEEVARRMAAHIAAAAARPRAMAA